MTDVKLVRFIAVLVVLAGYVLLFRAGEARIGDRVAANALIAEQLRDGERTLASRAALERERARLRNGLRSADARADRSALVARFVRDAASTASAHRTAITAIAASGTQQPVAGAFDPIGLDVTVEGRYADVLATVRALSEGRVLATVDVTSLARKNAAAEDGVLTAALRVVLERIAPEPAAEHPDAQPRPV